MPLERGEQLGLALLEALDAELEAVAVALAEAVVVELPHEGCEIGVLERVRQLLLFHLVGVPHRERPPVGGPRHDVVRGRVGDQVPRFPENSTTVDVSRSADARAMGDKKNAEWNKGARRGERAARRKRSVAA